MTFEPYAKWLGEQIDSLVPSGDFHRKFLSNKARVGLMSLDQKGLLSSVEYGVVYGSFVATEREQAPADIDIILFVKNLQPEQRSDVLSSKQNPGYPQAEISISDMDNDENMVWALSQLEGTPKRYGVTPIIIYPTEDGQPKEKHNV